MKMKKLLLSLSLAGFCLTQASAQSPYPGPGAAARRIGDISTDANGYDQRPEAFRADDARMVNRSNLLDDQMLAPTATTHQPGYTTISGGCGTGACNSFASACNTASGCGPRANNWFSAETLLWFAQDQQSAVLATTSAQGVLPVAGAPGVSNVFGGPDGMERGLLPGFRVSGGRYFGDCDKIGIGGRAFGIFSSEDQFNATSDGTTTLGVPFFNVAGLPTPLSDAYLVGFSTAGGIPVSSGNISARSDLDMITAEGSVYVLLGRSNDHRIDLVGGYTFSKLKNSIGLHTESTNLFTGDLIPDGTIFTTDDLFATHNVFHGGHLGVLSSVVRNRVSLSTLSKISFGNMRQSRAITGSSLQDDAGTVSGFSGGLFAQQSNIGTSSRDTFAFIPELGVKLGYSFRENLQLTVGYTFLMYSSVAMAGEQMDSVLDLTQVGGPAGTRPATDFQDSSFWLQGVDLGLTWNF